MHSSSLLVFFTAMLYILYITGNCNLVYTIIRKRNVFHQLANLPTEHATIAKALSKRGKKFVQLTPESGKDLPTMEGATPAMEAEPGTLKTTLAATPSKSNIRGVVSQILGSVLVLGSLQH